MNKKMNTFQATIVGGLTILVLTMTTSTLSYGCEVKTEPCSMADYLKSIMEKKNVENNSSIQK